MTFPASEWLVLTRNFVAGSHPQNDKGKQPTDLSEQELKNRLVY